MKDILKKTIFYRIYKRLRQAINFKRTQTIKCDPSSLGDMDDREIRRIFLDPHIRYQWKKDQEKINLLDIPISHSGINKGDQRAIYYLVKCLKPVNILEIGTSVGYSLFHFALALGGLSDESRITTVDIRDMNDPEKKHWLESGANRSPKELLETLNLSERVEFMIGDSHKVMEGIEKKFDLIFLDGSHEAGDVYREAARALSMLKDGGFILLHDYFPEGKPLWTRQETLTGPYWALKRMKRETGGLKVIPLGELPWRTKGDSRKTSLALISKQSSGH